MEVTRNEKTASCAASGCRIALYSASIPLHALKEVTFESRLAWLRMTRRGESTRALQECPGSLW
jgi:hypothetical protein